MFDLRKHFRRSRALVGKLAYKARRARRLLVIDSNMRRFIEHNRKVWGGWPTEGSDAVVLMDFYGAGETEIARSYFVNVLAKKHDAAIKSFGPPVRVPNRAVWKIYESFNVTEHVQTVLSAEQEQRKRAIAEEVIPRLRTKQDVFDLNVCGIWIGIDVYETYLKGGKPTVFMDDPRLFELIEEGIGLVVFWQEYFARHRVVAAVLSHDCYLRFNVVAKVAYRNRLPVYLPNARGIWLVKEPLTTYAYCADLRQMFKRLSPEEQKSAIEWGKEQLERRLNGEVGADMPYATASAFRSSGNEKPVLRNSDKIKVLICTHCFYDNPHGMGGLPFVDFYEWVRYLGRTAERTDYDWYLKVHPDPLPGTVETVEKILTEFPRITLIPHDTPHHQLAKEGIKFVLTCYGSVGHEYPALGVQVINAGHNLRVAYNFNWHPKSLEEYEWYLLNLDKLQKEIELEELYEFYYMHHCYALADDLIFNSYKQCLMDLTPEQRVGSTVYGYFLDQLKDVKHEEIIGRMREFIDSGKSYYFSRGPEG